MPGKAAFTRGLVMNTELDSAILCLSAFWLAMCSSLHAVHCPLPLSSTGAAGMPTVGLGTSQTLSRNPLPLRRASHRCLSYSDEKQAACHWPGSRNHRNFFLSFMALKSFRVCPCLPMAIFSLCPHHGDKEPRLISFL